MKENRFDPDEMPKWLSQFFKTQNNSNLIAGINEDDCAILKLGNEELVITTDYLNANTIATEMGLSTFEDLGRLLVAVNISDICGTGAKPIGFLAALMFKKEEANEKEFYLFMNGIKKELSKYRIPLIGGDTKLGNANSFCGTAIGKKEKGTKLFLKNAAKVGDSIWVSSKIGSVSAALAGLKEGGMDESWEKWAKDCIIKPRLPVNLSNALAKSKMANGGTDISDGLGADLWSMCEASGVGAIVWPDRIPISSYVKTYARKQNFPAWHYAFAIGGDFQFMTTSEEVNDEKMKLLGFYKIGKIIKEKEAFIIYNATKLKMPKIGHRDSKTVSFSSELQTILKGLQNQTASDC